MCTLRDSEALSLVENTVVLGISTDSVYCHREFADEQRIDFPLLSDSDGSVAEAYGVLADEFDDHRGSPAPPSSSSTPTAVSSTPG
ncbi:redoxin domain-containing protein [Natronoarchaeum sp. GCM10025703]|uniref:redoxin domain-containing protein n=1 Tax=Natronoarchaeum sp. GCM10025703 TaxID=3252685 RepID=UPI003613AB47